MRTALTPTVPRGRRRGYCTLADHSIVALELEGARFSILALGYRALATPLAKIPRFVG